MLLKIDGRDIIANPGETLLSLIQRLNLDNGGFAQRPIAAKIAGEVFNLNYVPVRDENSERMSIRKAMAASNGNVSLIRYDDPVGKDVYVRTTQFIMFLALHILHPGARVKMNCMVGKALYVEVYTDSFSASALKEKVLQLVSADIPLVRERVSLEKAIEHYRQMGQLDKAELLKYRNQDYFDQYSYGDFSDYYYGELAPSTGYMQVWDVLPAEGGFIFVYPDDNLPSNVAVIEQMPNLLQVCEESERWCELMECQTVSDLNAFIKDGRIRELVRVNEALHEKRFSQIADTVCEKEIKVVMLAGPSSSGKTTSANRLATQLRVHGKKPVMMSLDDYYLDRDQIVPGPDGKLDLEHINTIDTELFGKHMEQLLSGETISLPTFDFKTGKRIWNGHALKMTNDTVIIVEGLHALNPQLLPMELDRNLVFKLYVSPLIPLNLDDHNRIPTSLLRLLRRTVRDYNTRGASVQRTMEMWDSVRKGEKIWIFPYQEEADAILNSSTLYEIAVLKKYIYPLLIEVQPEDSAYEQVRGMVKILNYVCEADVESEIPPTSLVREFIGGNSYYQ